uniref:Uncharacterized protein n=1 Tax=Arundo donax TaxID=35708 RepID=A0A0A9H6Y5_ARUDO
MSAGLNLGNLFDSEQVRDIPDFSVVAYNIEIAIGGSLRSS